MSQAMVLHMTVQLLGSGGMTAAGLYIMRWAYYGHRCWVLVMIEGNWQAVPSHVARDDTNYMPVAVMLLVLTV